MAQNMQNKDQSNKTLYFIVGGILVVLVLIAFSVWNPDTAPEDISPAAGMTAADQNNTEGSLSVPRETTGDTETNRPSP